ncbi:hypothetical protein EV202_11025 [Bacteroides heparinolyticus]|uniref:Uncharacterized protein n=1 Tax=Prevotella heparinolytica TaxID=28113 RepID=A0A4R2LMR7_9BACE|nr:hypothetical protein EV202_11025 [Bacteroides heparinolyticus]
MFFLNHPFALGLFNLYATDVNKIIFIKHSFRACLKMADFFLKKFPYQSNSFFL